jgi:hypothetical protein
MAIISKATYKLNLVTIKIPRTFISNIERITQRQSVAAHT